MMTRSFADNKSIVQKAFECVTWHKGITKSLTEKTNKDTHTPRIANWNPAATSRRRTWFSPWVATTEHSLVCG